MCFTTSECFSFNEEQHLSSDDSERISSEEWASSDEDTGSKPSSSFGLPTTKTVLSNYRQFNRTQYNSFTNGFTLAI